MYRDMEMWTEIRRKVLTGQSSKRAILREYGIHWKTLEKILRHEEPPDFQLSRPRPKPKLGSFLPIIHEILKQDRKAPKKQRHTPEQMFELATVYSRLAQPPDIAPEVSGDQDLGESERNAELALETLRKAVDAGYRDVEILKTLRDLDPLRGRDDFWQLVATLEKTVQAEQLAARSSGTDAKKLEDRQRAAGLLDELLAEQPESFQHQQALAATLYSIGLLQTGLKQYGKAERSLQRALELRDVLRTQRPDSAGAAIHLAEVRFALGRLYWATDRRPEAHRLWREVLLEVHQVAMENPEDRVLQQRVASWEREICHRYGALGLWDLAATVAQHNAALERVTAYQVDADFAILLAASGEQEAWREYCQYAVGYRRLPCPQIVRTCCLFDPPAIDAEECIALASEFLASEDYIKNLAKDPDKRYHTELCMALAQCRVSRYGDALKTIESHPLNSAWESISGQSSKVSGGYIYALAAGGDGRNEQAEAQLERAERLYQSICRSTLAPDRKELPAPLDRYPWELALAQVFRREAWQKIKGQAPPGEPWCHLVQARGYGLLGESERAEKEFAAAVAAAPDDAEIWIARARVFEQLGDAARAEADRRKAGELGAGTEAGGARTPKE